MNGWPLLVQLNAGQKMKRLLSILALCLGASTLSAQQQYHRPPGMPENQLVAFDDYKPQPDTATLRELLGIKSFQWMVQIPDSARFLTVDISWIDTRSQSASAVASLAFDALPADPTKRNSRPKFFPLRMTMMPDDSKSEDPWRTSRSFVVLLEAPDLNTSIRQSYSNPFRRSTGPLSTHYTTQIATPLPKQPGMWDGFGTAFDVMAGGDRGKHVLRVSFSTSPLVGEQ